MIGHLEDLRDKHLIASNEAATVLQKHFKRFFMQREFQKTKRRVIIIQSYARCQRCYRLFKHLKLQTIKLQSHIRGRTCALEYQKLRAS